MPIQKPPYLSAAERRRFAVIMALPESHPVRAALCEFYRCRAQYVGFEISPEGAEIDQEWFSTTLKHKFRLSYFLYVFVSIDSPPFAAWGDKKSITEQEFLDKLPE